MRIYIPTRGRASKQLTYNALPLELRKVVVFVVNSKDDLPIGATNVVECPVSGIGNTRQWIADEHNARKYGRNIIMLDDDLRFARRRKDDPTKFEAMDAGDFMQMFAAVEHALSANALVSVCSREGGNNMTKGDELNIRCLRFLAYDAFAIRGVAAKFNDLPVMEDFHVALSLLRAGHTSLTLTKWAQDNAGGSNSPGGCSTYRTSEVQAEGARRLKELHPMFVKVVEKSTKTAWGGGTRVDVTVRWKDAYRSSQV